MQEQRTITRRRNQRGSTLVEFGLVVLPLFALLFLTIDLGWLLFGYASIQEGVREGVRYAVTGQTAPGLGQDASILQVVETYSFGFVKPANAATQVGIQYYDPTTLAPLSGVNSNAGGNVVKITVSGVRINPFGPIWRNASPILLGAVSSDIVEPSPPGGPPPR